jgi:hypothetical protein
MEDKLAARKSTSGSDVTTKSTRETDIPATFYSILILTRMISGRKVDRSPPFRRSNIGKRGPGKLTFG